VNGRFVRAENLHRGLDDAYRATVPGGRYPPVALEINVDPRRVDVNVHPTKQIVRFSEERAARDALAAAVRDAIEWRAPATVTTPRPPERTFTQGSLSPRPSWEHTSRVAEDRPLYPAPPTQDLQEVRERLAEASRPLAEERVPYGEVPERGALPALEDLLVIGQLAAGYVLVEEPEQAMWVVDQHVAHERAILDRLHDSDSPATMQSLLVPEVVELSPSEAEIAAASLDELSVYGFEAEPFGPRSIRVTAVISTLADRDVAGAFKDALSAITGTDPGHNREDRILATIACHSAVKMGHKLSQAEMEALIKEWLTSRLPATCPHGRSICFRVGLHEVARKLDRH
jgi:DNA mismatch repair protein MutL